MTSSKMSETEMRSLAASMLGSIRSERKAAASRENGKKGGRPPLKGRRRLPGRKVLP